ncbi:MAG: hypothetical protein ACFB10_19330, partial [Salibacteraceae bacterium]
MIKPLLFFSALLIASNLTGQNFAPVGTEWHFNKSWIGKPHINDVVKVTAIKATLIQGELCTVVGSNDGYDCYYQPIKTYILSKNDSVWVYNTALANFQLLYDFGAQSNDTWVHYRQYYNEPIPDTLIFTVLGAADRTINGNTLRAMMLRIDIHSSFGNDQIFSYVTERLGADKFLFDWYIAQVAVCDGTFPNNLRCFSDTTGFTYNTGDAPYCDYTNVSINEWNQPKANTINPNPAKGMVQKQTETLEQPHLQLHDLQQGK